MTSEIAVLGCGPSGLVAANTVEQMGHRARVFSEPKKSYIAGAQYSHAPILGHDNRHEPEAMITLLKQGDREGYAEKVYGKPDAPVSWDRYTPGDYPAWSMCNTYEALWEHWWPSLVPCTLDPESARQAAISSVVEGVEFDAVINTVPLRALCDVPWHQFASQGVYIVQYEDRFPKTDSYILYNGLPAPSWYRESIIFGNHAYEWSDRLKQKPPVDDVVKITKPVATNCDCFYKGTDRGVWLNVGRYGAWDKAWLISTVQTAVVNFMWGR